MTAWNDRPSEEARLFNPAFLVAVLVGAVHDYSSGDEAGMPWMLGFLVPPLVLAERTRRALPSRTTAHFANWLDEHPEVRFSLGPRARALVPLTREALRVGVRTGALELTEGRLRAGVSLGAAQNTSDEVGDCLHAARFLGRWFASRHDVKTTFGLLGVRP